MLCKGLLLSGVALLVASTSAFSADVMLVRKAPQPAAAAPLPPVWAGFYAGPTLGWARGDSTGYYQGTTPGTSTTPPPTPATTLPTSSPAPGPVPTFDIPQSAYQRCKDRYSTVVQRNARAQGVSSTRSHQVRLPDTIFSSAASSRELRVTSVGSAATAK
jgi:hypothetical protein